MSSLPFLPYGRQVIEDDDVAAVTAVLRGDYLTTGPEVPLFEAALADVTGAGHVVVCANGTAALHLAALALDISPGDVVIVPSVTFLASANAMAFAGAEIVFADVNPDTGLMTPDTFAEALERAGPRARAVVVVHLAGQTTDLRAIETIARAAGLAIVEDACHALGARWRDGSGWGRVGDARASDVATFSFHPVKTIAMGEGGAVTTNDPVLADRMRALRNHGMTRDPRRFSQRAEAFAPDGGPNPWYYEMAAPGLNYRASDIACALGRSQLAKLDRFVAARGALMAHYAARFSRLGSRARLLALSPACQPAWHLAVALIDFTALGLSRAEVMASLSAHGIGSQVHYLPLHRQAYWRGLDPDLQLPGADAFYARCLSLPLFPSMTETDVDRVIAALDAALAPRLTVRRAAGPGRAA